MSYPLISSQNPFTTVKVPKFYEPLPPKSFLSNSKSIFCFHHQDPKNTIDIFTKPSTLLRNPITVSPSQVYYKKSKKQSGYEESRGFSQVGSQHMLLLCGFGYGVQGFRCFPWLALNVHMARNLNLHPSTLQLVQNAGNFPMVAKPLYGLLSDTFYIGGAHRIPYVSIGG